MYAYRESYVSEILSQSQKFYIESYLEMSLATFINLYAFAECKSTAELLLFFKGCANFINSVLTLLLAILMVVFVVYWHNVIRSSYKHIEKKTV